MKILKYIVIFTLFVCVFVWLGTLFYKKYKAIDLDIFTLEYNLSIAQDLLREKKTVDHLSMEFESTILPLSKDSLDKIPTDVVVVRLHENICMSCYFSATKYLFDKMGKNEMSFIVLGSYLNKGRFKKQLKELELLETRAFNMPFISQDYPLDGVNIPYVFILSPQREIKELFFLDKSDSTSSNEYISMIQRINECKYIRAGKI